MGHLRATGGLLSLAVLVLLAVPARGQVDAALIIDQDRLQGTATNGQLLLFAPDPVQLGSSISHWDPSAAPNLLMEPSINPDLPFLGLDLTDAQLKDIGWTSGSSSFTVSPLDPSGTGFDDPRPFAGAPGNPATTLGDARNNLVDAVLATWGGVLSSSVDIDVLVTWTPLPCTEGAGAVLGSATTVFVFKGGDLPVPDTWYQSALAEAIIGEDLSGPPDEDGGDVMVFLNSDIDEECLGAGTGFYYGLDGNAPPNQVDLTSTVLHELAHGLGFGNFTNEATGEEFQGLPSIFDQFTLDLTAQRTWAEMSEGERVISATNSRNVVWSGAQANEDARELLEPGVPELVVAAPVEAAGVYNVGTALFGPPIPDGGLSGEIACLKDGVSDLSILNGCTAATNAQELEGKIALIDRGDCLFSDKVANAQTAGAIAAIIVNKAGNDVVAMGGNATGIDIPAVSVGRGDGRTIRRAACPAEAALFECVASKTTMCLGSGGRFRFEVDWRDFGGNTGSASVVPFGSEDSGLFYFFAADNWEMLVKVIDGCPLNERFWVFAAATTNVEYTLRVVDTETGAMRTYFNPLGVSSPAITDTDAFATCP